MRTVLPIRVAALGSMLIACSALPAEETRYSAYHDHRVVTVADGLVRPWSLAFLPDGDLLVTEKPGRLHEVKELFETQSRGSGHYGLRLAFDGRRHLFITIGDRQAPAEGDLQSHPAQDLSNHHGGTHRDGNASPILRLEPVPRGPLAR
jgi:glucose/arabinose dehydrogenase